MKKTEQQLNMEANAIGTAVSHSIKGRNSKLKRQELVGSNLDLTKRSAEQSVAIAKRLVGGGHAKTV